MKKLVVLLSVFSITFLSSSALMAESSSPTPEIVHFDKNASSYHVRVHYLDGAISSADLVILGVGTTMNTNSYDRLSAQIAHYGYVVVILDHQPGNMLKMNKNRYRDAVISIRENILNWLDGSGIKGINKVLVGGHSGGGQAAQGAVNMDPGLADGIFSIDPFNCNNEETVDLPAMYWGFDVTTCFVTKENAAMACYDKSLGKRAFYRVARQYKWTMFGYAPQYLHCSFADNGCPGCTNCESVPDHFYVDVAASVDQFIRAAFYGTWSKSDLQISATTPVTLFEGSDQP